MSMSAIVVDVVVGGMTSVPYNHCDRMMHLIAVGKFGKMYLDPKNKRVADICIQFENKHFCVNYSHRKKNPTSNPFVVCLCSPEINHVKDEPRYLT